MTTEGPCRINTILYNNLYVSYVLQQHLGLWPMGVEDVGVVCAVHHLAAGLLVFVTAAAVGAVGFGSMPISGHPVACVAHNASLFVVLLDRREERSTSYMHGYKSSLSLIVNYQTCLFVESVKVIGKMFCYVFIAFHARIMPPVQTIHILLSPIVFILKIFQ